MTQSYLFVTKTSFQESVGLVSATFIELDKISDNGRLYKFSEAQEIIKGLVGSPVRYGVNWLGQHIKGSKAREIGFVESAKLVGKKIIGSIRITAKDILSRLKSGIKFLLSVGGEGLGIIRKGFTEMRELEVTHVQIWESGQKNILGQPQTAGFPSAKVEKILEIQESVLYAGSKDKFIALMVALGVI